jgi:hypothetical protein
MQNAAWSILYTPPWVPCGSAWTTWTPHRPAQNGNHSVQIHMDPWGMGVIPHGSTWNLSDSAQTMESLSGIHTDPVKKKI